ncbi:alkaline phosphatase family protein [Vibrio alginolyticus]|uniref:alkaline phosphatase D family protein n=1 Tax=Vibrio alginolyticus TaxID=663 RepID=UPI001BD5D3CB|nr:alkaline phosphatase D family protein [Vibrio alginolyticus]MBS9896772.1 alkaline phosphatase family protein [Vibrio alginolyticus]
MPALMNTTEISSLPLVVAGPILRKVTATEINIWLVTTQRLEGMVQITDENASILYQAPLSEQKEQLQIGLNAWCCLLKLEGEFPTHQALRYQIKTQYGLVTELLPHLTYERDNTPNLGIEFLVSEKADYLLHGSCRNPHQFSDDTLVAADHKIASQSIEERPDMLIMSGDQIYADHVAGPTLDAIEQVIALLGLPGEEFDQAPIKNTNDLYQHPACYYGRDKLLPHYVSDDSLLSKFFPHRGTPIFSAKECENHLISFAECFAMYLLVWSPTLWKFVRTDRLLENEFTVGGEVLEPKWQQQWREEKKQIDKFVAGLDKVQRLLAHIPTYMIFDDHDVTDDWNLTIGWEQAAYSNTFAKRIIGNSLIAYWLCQGWGNAPEKFNDEFMSLAQRFIDERTSQTQDAFIQYLYRFENWHYTIPTTPKVVVLDTRTRRWRSESKMNKPSGLMDWEAMIEFHQELVHQDKVVIVSAAPMFGVKFIEALQRVVTMLGKPLMVDAENWMAHPGSANTLISIFTHTKTPTNFVILSGDVHYSFAYDIKLRYRKNSPNIYQITCSGIKNQFPTQLLNICDGLDRLLYSPRSPLNWFTKRKRLKIYKRAPSTHNFYRLVNHSAIGELRLDDEGKPSQISILTSDGDEVHFPPTRAES